MAISVLPPVRERRFKNSPSYVVAPTPSLQEPDIWSLPYLSFLYHTHCISLTDSPRPVPPSRTSPDKSMVVSRETQWGFYSSSLTNFIHHRPSSPMTYSHFHPSHIRILCTAGCFHLPLEVLLWVFRENSPSPMGLPWPCCAKALILCLESGYVPSCTFFSFFST